MSVRGWAICMAEVAGKQLHVVCAGGRVRTPRAVAYCSRCRGAECCVLPRRKKRRSAMSAHAAAAVRMSPRASALPPAAAAECEQE